MPQRASAPPSRLLAAAERAAAAAVVDAGAFVHHASQRQRARTARRKGVGDFVTAIDIAAERRLRHDLLAALPTAGFLGEETTATGLDNEFVWIVDPIDGTSNFANRLPHWATAVALLWRGQPVIAAIWAEPEQALYTARLGHGARRAGKRVRTGSGRWDDGSIVGCQWHRGQQDLEFLAALQRRGTRVRTFGCTVVQLLDVAIGRLDANVQQQGRLWDFAAPSLVLTEAGGRFSDWRGNAVWPCRDLRIGHTPTIGAPPAVHRHLVRALAPLQQRAQRI